MICKYEIVFEQAGLQNNQSDGHDFLLNSLRKVKSSIKETCGLFVYESVKIKGKTDGDNHFILIKFNDSYEKSLYAFYNVQSTLFSIRTVAGVYCKFVRVI